MSSPVAIVTGASSGIGLALTKHLLSQNWSVVLLDVQNPPAEAALPKDKSLYIHCDVGSWDSQAAAFKQAFEWKGRLDFAALNAGIDDRDDIFRTAALDQAEFGNHAPRKPDMSTFDVNLLGAYYGAKLFTHYYLRNPSKSRKLGCIVMTSSMAGLYPHAGVPQYTATKYGVVGLVRSLAPVALKVSGIRVNSICPAFVPTNLAPPGLMEAWPKSGITPMSTIMRAYDEFLDEEKAWNGQCVEASLEELTYRGTPVPPGSEKVEIDIHPLRLFDEIYRERNIKFARRSKI
ncbi:NAD(P)-binding protein [Mollisia scopiformis]|uniref:NAD(P)-binding protein n=1 Tax=Mollisia scopiformis TaxID=149040 RepID=A0A194WY09_MOLSC|nr:NAD(P)-binding protein [Mollisia scopiformis]KUJ12861.1 NAD(P)-binding protein [Mollisia scopiformis]